MHSTPTAVFSRIQQASGKPEFTAFHDPFVVWSVSHASEMRAAFERVHELQCAGYYVCAMLSYESAPAFDRALAAHEPGRLPLAWFAAFGRGYPFNPAEGEFHIGAPRVTTDRDKYVANVRAVLDHIRAGDIYQANYTVRAECEFAGDPFAAFCALAAATQVPHACYLDLGEATIVSLSPELFISLAGDTIHSQPMKGTAARRPSWEEDEAESLALGQSEKDRAELTMIVDLMRNDLGRVCRTGSIRTSDEFRVTRYPTVHQMTTRVTGRMSSTRDLFDVFRAVFPAGSVTGAPKVRAMQIIRDLEEEPRGVYCGSLVLFEPEGDFTASVAIRTLEIRGNRAIIGVGSGIVADSDPAKEWDEVLLKLKFTQLRPQTFGLYEAFRYEPRAGFQSIDHHLKRLQHSCRYFGRDFPCAEINEKLQELRTHLGDSPNRIRVDLFGKDITLRLIPEELSWSEGGVIVMIPDLRLNPENPLLYHKTTLRPEKYTLRSKAKERGADECLFLNNRNEFTEGTLSSYIFKLHGAWITPALSCGLLPGVWRDRQIRTGRVREGIVTFDQLSDIEEVVIGNSVRGEQRVIKILNENGSELYRAREVVS